jgi:hypothetical protein
MRRFSFESTLTGAFSPGEIAAIISEAIDFLAQCFSLTRFDELFHASCQTSIPFEDRVVNQFRRR